jgi:hypothetical protein
LGVVLGVVAVDAVMVMVMVIVMVMVMTTTTTTATASTFEQGLETSSLLQSQFLYKLRFARVANGCFGSFVRFPIPGK